MNQQVAVFLDRDGTINVEVGDLHKIEDLKILPRISKAIKILNNFGMLLIVVTNQPVIARGWITENGVKKINNEIKKLLQKDGAIIEHFYYCPHHPEATLEKYRIICECRKPKSGLLKKAAKKFKLNLQKSYMVGDTFRDIEAAKAVGCIAIGVKSGTSNFKNSKPDFLVKDLFDAAKLILRMEEVA